MDTVRVRFAPSPTGYLHIGGLRTALFNYLYARHTGGKFILRIEDTDRTRFVEGALENLIEVLHWAGLEYDEGVFLEDGKLVQKGEFGSYIQSERVAQGIYQKYAEQLLEEGKAYYCFCTEDRLQEVREKQKETGLTPRYDGHCRDIPLEEARARVAAGEEHVIRMKLPENLDITFKDAIKGEITINTDEMDDQVLMKSDGFPTYHFAVVVDDHHMQITHVVRGEEWVTSTPKHVFLYNCFGWEQPTFVHLPTVLGQDHKKLSKRNGDVSVESFVEKGYLRDALINYISLLGWSPKGNEEILSKQELIDQFDFDRVSNTGGIFDVQKLDWVNGQYVRQLPVEEVAKRMRPYLVEAHQIPEDYPDEKLNMVAETFQNYIERFSQSPELVSAIFQKAEELTYLDEAVGAMSTAEAHVLYDAFLEKLDGVDAVDHEFASTIMKTLQKENGIKGKNLWFPIRAALTGSVHGPDLTNILQLLGKEEIRARLENVKKKFPVVSEEPENQA